jgi:hypothetical protein
MVKAGFDLHPKLDFIVLSGDANGHPSNIDFFGQHSTLINIPIVPFQA